jgi:hypothetical protein
MGFAVSTVAVFMTAWIVYAATRRAAYLEGFSAGRIVGRASVLYPDSVPERFRDVPAGTCATPCHPADCDDSCPRYPEVQRLARAHVALDDRIYGRNG